MTNLHIPSDTEMYNAGYNKANDTEKITTGFYESPTNDDEHQIAKRRATLSYHQATTAKRRAKTAKHEATFAQLHTTKRSEYRQWTAVFDRTTTAIYCTIYDRSTDVTGGLHLAKAAVSVINVSVTGSVSDILKSTPGIVINCDSTQTLIETPMKPRSNTDLRCEAILFCLCSFWPTGIAAIIYAQKAAHAYKEGKIADGNRYYSRTDKLIIASILIGMLILVLFFIIKQTTYPIIYTTA